MKKGDKISKNFELDVQIKSIKSFVFAVENNPSIYWRFKVTSSAFFLSWHLRTILISLKAGHFWTVKKIINNK